MAEAENNARAEERARIKAIRDNAPDGYETIVEDAMFTNPATIEAVAVKILAEQKKQGGAYLANREADVTDSGVAQVGASASEKGNETEDPYNDNAAIDRLFPDVK